MSPNVQLQAGRVRGLLDVVLVGTDTTQKSSGHELKCSLKESGNEGSGHQSDMVQTRTPIGTSTGVHQGGATGCGCIAGGGVRQEKGDPHW
jgi:hypothetical protein